MKKLLLLSSVALLLAACGDKANEDGASKINGSSKSSEVSKKDTDKSSAKKSGDASQSKSKDDTSKKVESKEVAKSNTKGNVEILSDAFRQDYMFNDHRFALGEIKFGMSRNDVEQIYGAPNGKVPKEIASPSTAAVYGNYLVTYGPKDEVRQIAVVADKTITKSDFLKLFVNPSEDNDKFLIYNSNDENGYKITAAFDESDHLIGLYQTNDIKGMRDAGGDDYSEEVDTAFKDAMYDYAKQNNKAVSSRFFKHGGGPTEDFYANTEDGLILMQSLMNPGRKVYDISVKSGVVVYDAKSGVKGKDEDADNLSGFESLNPLIKPGTTFSVYILANNGKVYEFTADQSEQVESYFSMVMPTWGLNYKGLPVLKEAQDQKVRQIGKDAL